MRPARWKASCSVRAHTSARRTRDDRSDTDASALCEESRWDFSDLRALHINCTLKRSPEVSHTRALADRSIAIMQRNGVSVDVVRVIGHDIATGVQPDMTEHGWERDGWPAIFEQVIAADILVLLSRGAFSAVHNVCGQDS